MHIQHILFTVWLKMSQCLDSKQLLFLFLIQRPELNSERKFPSITRASPRFQWTVSQTFWILSSNPLKTMKSYLYHKQILNHRFRFQNLSFCKHIKIAHKYFWIWTHQLPQAKFCSPFHQSNVVEFCYPFCSVACTCTWPDQPTWHVLVKHGLFWKNHVNTCSLFAAAWIT